MDELNKNQLILLALLVSFVTSIATGIATVSLLDQAPAEVTRVINRVVERTVETVSSEGPVVTETEIIVQEEELVTAAIVKNQNKIVRIYNGPDQFLGNGLIVSADGKIVSTKDIGNLEEVSIELNDETILTARREKTTESLSLFQIQDSSSIEFESATFPALDNIKLGQTVVALFGKENIQIALGAISQLVVPTEENNVMTLGSTINIEGLNAGSLIVNLAGNVVGIVGTGPGGNTLVPFTQITGFVGE